MGKVVVFTLGHVGVVLDPHDLEPGVPLEALEIAQNAIQDPREGHGGAIRKRPGLAQFNPAYAGGIILGGIPMPVAGFGGAPTAGGGAIIGTGDADDGSSVGTGDMTGAPGGTFDGGAAATTTPGAGIFGGGEGGVGTLFGGARLFIVGRLGSDTTVGQEGGSGWFVSSKGLADSAIIRIPPGPPIASYSYPPTLAFPSMWGTPYAVDTIGLSGLYYASAYGDQTLGVEDRTIPTGALIDGNPIRNTNGAIDRLVTTIPLNTSNNARSDYDGTPPYIGVVRSAVTCMHQGTDGFIYICVKDKYTGQSTTYPTAATASTGRVFRMDATSGALVEWNIVDSGASIFNPTNYVPIAANYFNAQLFVGVFFNVIDDANIGLVAINGTEIASEGTFSGTGGVGTGKSACVSFCQYNGRLFMGTAEWRTTPGLATLFSRRPGAYVDDTGNAWVGSVLPTSGAAVNGNFWPSMAVFNGALYATFYNPGNPAKIYKIVANDPGDPLSTSFTVTTVLSGMNNVPHWLFVDDGVIYAIGANGGASSESAFVSFDGTTWVEKTANLPSGATNSSILPIFFGVNQS